MNSDVTNVLYYRAKLLANVDKLNAEARKKKSMGGQLSLFAEEHVDIEISLDEPEDFNPIEMAIAEKEVLGFSLTYSLFDEYFMVQCRYCNSNIASLLNNETDGNVTLLAEIKAIDYKTSQYGNKYAKVVFADSTGEERMYLFGKLYEKMISKCFVGTIYLLTVKQSDDKTKIDIVNFMPANAIPDVSRASRNMYVTTTVSNIPELRMYLKSYMMGTLTDVTVKVSDLDVIIPSICRVKIDNENLLEMSKKGFIISLR